MFRSGTTMLARLLNVHPEIAFASDPFAPLFKEFRNAIARAEGLEVDPSAPLDDYYYLPEKQAVFEAVRRAGTDLPLRCNDADGLRRLIVDRARPFSPLIGDHIDALSLESFRQAIESGCDIIRRTYGDENSKAVGFKEVWTGEFAPHLLTAFPDTVVVYVVRDPRAVCSSKNVTANKYPWLFLARQWRKLAAVAWHLDQQSTAGTDRVLVVRYEDLISDPAPFIERICEMAGVDFSDDMLDPTRFRDGAGKSWQQNSSYSDNKQSFNAQSVAKWKQVLSAQEIGFIEAVCYWEMRLFDYRPEVFDPADPDSAYFLAPPVVSDSQLADWIKPFASTDESEVIPDSALDYARHVAIAASSAKGNADKRSLSLYPELFDHYERF